MKTLLVVHAGLSHPSHTATVAQDIADAVVAQVSKRGEGLEVATPALKAYVIPIFEEPQAFAGAPWVREVGFEAVGRPSFYSTWLAQR